MSMPQELSKQQSQVSEAGQPQEYVAANAEKGRRMSNMASPARSDRQRLIQAWKPTDEARPASRNVAISGPSPMAKGMTLFHMCPWICAPRRLSVRHCQANTKEVRAGQWIVLCLQGCCFFSLQIVSPAHALQYKYLFQQVSRHLWPTPVKQASIQLGE